MKGPLIIGEQTLRNNIDFAVSLPPWSLTHRCQRYNGVLALANISVKLKPYGKILPHMKGWEFAHGFSSKLLVFCERKCERTIRSWKIANRSCRSFVLSDLCQIAHGRSFVKSDGSELLKLLFLKSEWAKSDRSESLKSLFIKERMSEEWREQFTLGHKEGENCLKHTKKMFGAIRSFFASNLSK